MEKGLTNEEILRQQLELLAEYSKNEVVDGHELAQVSNSMTKIYEVLDQKAIGIKQSIVGVSSGILGEELEKAARILSDV